MSTHIVLMSYNGSKNFIYGGGGKIEQIGGFTGFTPKLENFTYETSGFT